jgi:hypothetical protein
MPQKIYAHSLSGRPPEEWLPLEEHLIYVAELAKKFTEPFWEGDWAIWKGGINDRLRSRSQIVILKQGQNIKYLPFAFTEQGVAMLSSVLRSKRAAEVNIQIMRAFVKLREMIASHTDLSRKLDALEKKYDDNFKVVFEAIRALMTPPPEKPKKKIGFGLREKQAGYGKKGKKTA